MFGYGCCCLPVNQDDGASASSGRSTALDSWHDLKSTHSFVELCEISLLTVPYWVYLCTVLPSGACLFGAHECAPLRFLLSFAPHNTVICSGIFPVARRDRQATDIALRISGPLSLYGNSSNEHRDSTNPLPTSPPPPPPA